jgi:hypothetical protein
MYQVVLATFTAVAMPCSVRVLLPVVPKLAKIIVSVVIAIVVVAPEPEINTIVVPIGSAKAEFAGIVKVLVAVE